MQHQSLKRFDSNRGLDLKSTDINRDQRFASAMLNAQYNNSGEIEKRRGFQCHSDDSATGFGIFTYKRIDEDGLLEEIVLSAGRNLKKLLFSNLVVDYAGAEASATISIFYDPSTSVYRCQIMAGTSQVLDMSLGAGIDDAVPVTINDLDTAISALTGFTASVTGDGTVPAAFLKTTRDYDCKANTFTGVAAYWSQVNSPITNVFDGLYAIRNSLNFENISAVNISNLIFFSNGIDEVMKYDGQNIYRAGMPLPASLTSVLGGAGAVTGSNYFHRAQYVQHDAVGNIVEGNILPVTAGLSPAAQQMTITVANIQSSSGFNTNAAIVNGAQVGVTTITVDNGSGGSHTMKAGDTAYFYDAISATYVEREVTSVGATTITIAGAAVTVADNAVISNNLRIMIQRNKTSAITPTVFYEVVQLPNNPFTATQAYTDNLADASLGALIIPPATDRSPPPKGKYLTSFQNLLFIANLASDKRRFAWSDIDGVEYFPADTNQDVIESGSGDEISGIGAEGSFLSVFSENSTFVGAGTFGDNNYRIELKAASIGCSSHSSIVNVEGFIAWWSDRGPYKMSGGQIPSAIGATPEGDSRISPVTNQRGYEFNDSLVESFYRSKRCVAINWLDENKLLFFLPCESLDGSNRYVNSNSRIFAYDYTRDAWLEWSVIDMSGGACLYQDEFFFVGRRLNSSTVKSNLFRIHNLNDALDYQDNLEPIRQEYAPQWEFVGEPSKLKKFLEIMVYSLGQVNNNTFNLTIQQEINFMANAPISEFTLELTGSGYGQSAYGTDPYGDQAEPRFKHELGRVRAYSMRPKFINEEDQTNCVITGWEILFAAPYRTEFKR